MAILIKNVTPPPRKHSCNRELILLEQELRRSGSWYSCGIGSLVECSCGRYFKRTAMTGVRLWREVEEE